MKQYLKALALLAAFSAAVVCCDNQSRAGLPPTTTKGQSDASAATNFFFQVPYNQSTLTAGVTHLFENGYENLLINPSFEHSTFSTSWSTGGSGASGAVETTNISSGKQSAAITFTTSTTGTLEQSVTPTIKMAGQNIDAGCDVKTSLTNIQVCQLQAGSVVGSCVSVPSTNVFTHITSTQAGPASGSVGVRIQTDGTSTTGTVYVDRCYVGYSPIPATAVLMTPWTSYTPSLANFGSVANVTVFWRRVGDSLEVQGKFVAGIPTGSAAQIGLPSGLTIDTTKLSATSQSSQLGIVTEMDAAATAYAGTNRGPWPIVDSVGTSTSFVYISLNAANATSYSASNANNVCAAGNTLSFFFRVPISGWNATTTLNAASVLTSNNTNPEQVNRVRVDATCSASPCTIASQSNAWVTQITRASTGDYTIVIPAGVYSSAPTCVGSAGIGNNDTLAFVNASNTATAVRFLTYAATANTNIDERFSIVCMGPH